MPKYVSELRPYGIILLIHTPGRIPTVPCSKPQPFPCTHPPRRFRTVPFSKLYRHKEIAP